MYKINLLKLTFILTLFCFVPGCKTESIRYNAEIQFSSHEHDFGELGLTQKSSYQFSFSNPGATPLLIQHVKTSCGCTVPVWPQKPIKPGEKAEITIDYDSSHPGRFHKTISVFYNGINSPVTLSIKGSVRVPEEPDETKIKNTL